MKRSCCIGYNDIDGLRTLSRIGFECIETNLSAVSVLSEKNVLKFRDYLDSLGLECVSFNGLLPSDIALFGDKYDKNALENYLSRAFYYASLAGAHIVTLGSGRSRNVPEGMDVHRAEEIFIDILRKIFVPYAEENGLVIGIEPLRAQECNFLNSCGSVMNVVNAVDERAVNLTVDVYHAYLSGESFEEMAQYCHKTVHVHISSVRNLRQYPGEIDIPDMKTFFAAMKAHNYRGAVSIEGCCQGRFDETAASSFKSISLSLGSSPEITLPNK